MLQQRVFRVPVKMFTLGSAYKQRQHHSVINCGHSSVAESLLRMQDVQFYPLCLHFLTDFHFFSDFDPGMFSTCRRCCWSCRGS
jgi:GTP cyclohydrolase I